MKLVFNLSTQQELYYNCSLSPKRVVELAWLYSHKKQPTDHITEVITEGQYTFCCGDWCCVKEGNE